MKMYILIKDTVPLGYAINSAAHAGAMAVLKWQNCTLEFQPWLEKSFKKVTCKVTEAEFEAVRSYSAYLSQLVVTESALKGEEIAIAIKPLVNDDDYPEMFKHLKLYRE